MVARNDDLVRIADEGADNLEAAARQIIPVIARVNHWTIQDLEDALQYWLGEVLEERDASGELYRLRITLEPDGRFRSRIRRIVETGDPNYTGTRKAPKLAR